MNMAKYIIETDERIIDFANRYRFPGWYIDSNGMYVCIVGKYLISIFINSCDDCMDITVDTIGESGFFDNNVEWESNNDFEEIAEAAKRFMCTYVRK